MKRRQSGEALTVVRPLSLFHLRLKLGCLAKSLLVTGLGILHAVFQLRPFSSHALNDLLGAATSGVRFVVASLCQFFKRDCNEVEKLREKEREGVGVGVGEESEWRRTTVVNHRVL